MNSNNLDRANILNLYKSKNYDGVIKLGLKLLKKNPKDYQLIYSVGLSYVNLQNYSEADKYFDKLLYVQEKPEIFFIQANIHKQLKKYDTSVAYFEKAIELNPNFSEAYNNLGNVKKRIGNIDEAISCFKKAIQFLSSTFFQKTDDFEGDLTGLFPKTSFTASKIKKHKKCFLDFFYQKQYFRISCSVKELKKDDMDYQFTFWHNFLFNSNLSPESRVLTFRPNWSDSIANPISN